MEFIKPYKLILDDYRSRLDVFALTRHPSFLADDWAVVKSHQEFVEKVTEMFAGGYFPVIVSFDHDLVDEHYNHLVNPIPYEKFTVPTGWHSAVWFKDFCDKNKIRPQLVFIHTMNPAGRQNIEQALGGLAL